jgi:MFS family permease
MTTAPDTLPIAAVSLAVALAVADSSVVVLRVRDLRHVRRIDRHRLVDDHRAQPSRSSSALGVLAVERRVRGHVLAGVGLGVFALASLVCGLSQSFEVLIVGRSVQGLGAALALVGAIPLLSGIRGSDAHAIRAWGLAGTIGLAVGPALGGFLTALFSWRSIFLLQHPAHSHSSRFDPRAGVVYRRPGARPRTALANASLAAIRRWSARCSPSVLLLVVV